MGGVVGVAWGWVRWGVALGALGGLVAPPGCLYLPGARSSAPRDLYTMKAIRFSFGCDSLPLVHAGL